jgi:exodeoxyribonuclease VII small subunit
LSKKKRTFEDDLRRLEELVRSLEQNELSLQESLEAFEEGSKLGESLMKELEKAQTRVMRLMKTQQGEFDLAPLDDEDEADD